MTPRPNAEEPLTSLWYEDGINAYRCKVCQHLKSDGHRAGCPVAELLAVLREILTMLEGPPCPR